MDTKLTLKLDKHIIDRAKMYAKKKHTSVSDIVENYLKNITQDQKIDNKNITSPIVDSLTGIIHLPDNYDYKQDYYNYIETKHK